MKNFIYTGFLIVAMLALFPYALRGAKAVSTFVLSFL